MATKWGAGRRKREENVGFYLKNSNRMGKFTMENEENVKFYLKNINRMGILLQKMEKMRSFTSETSVEWEFYHKK